MKSFLLAVWEVLEVVIVAVATVFIIRTFLVQPFLVSGASMDPTFNSGNYLIIDEITYRFREPQRGEVIVFKYPNNPSTYYIKRIVSLPGEKVSVQMGKVTVYNKENPRGLVLEEKYLPPGLRTTGNFTGNLKESEYFVLGDNRNYSYDSRSWGVLDKKYIVGIARLRLLPIAKAQVFSY